MQADSGGATENVIWHFEMLGRLRARCVLPHASVTIEKFQTQKTGLLLALLVLHHAAGSAAPPLYRDALAARLWPDAEQDAGRDRLSQALSWLRRHLETSVGLASGAVVQADRRMVRFAPGVISSDVAELDALFKKARAVIRREPAQAAPTLAKAIALHHGMLLPGIAEADDDLLLERHRIEAMFQDMVRQAALAEAVLGRLVPAIAYARRLQTLDAENEADCALLMRLLVQAGDAGGALRAWDAFAARLSAQNAPLPDALRRLAREIQQARETQSSSEPAALRMANASLPSSALVSASVSASLSAPATTLPLPLTRYFGRERELHLLQKSLQVHETRLLTLLGPGGTGKTRLAVEAARRFVAPAGTPGEADGSAPAQAAFFVSLENASGAAQIVPAVFRALQQAISAAPQESAPHESAPHEDGIRLRTVVARLLCSVGYPLLILDNCEHLAGSADVVQVLADLLMRVPSLTILATSRIRLGVDGEQQLLVRSLPSPHETLKEAETPPDGSEQDGLLAYPSVQMFLDRARRARVDFALSSANRDTIAALCKRLEGIPLAIELCAGWAATLAPSEMLAALDNRFDLLVSRRPDVPPRHRSLYAAVESSYLQLSPELQTAFCALAVFRGGWSSQAARAVIRGDAGSAKNETNEENEKQEANGDSKKRETNGKNGGEKRDEKTANARVRDSLAALQDRSLIFADSGPDGSAMRWRMLETLREFAWSQLNGEEQQAAASRHAAWFLQWAETIAPHLAKPGQREWLDMLEAEQDNFQAALSALRALSPASDRTVTELNKDTHRDSRRDTHKDTNRDGHADTEGTEAKRQQNTAVNRREIEAAFAGLRLCIALDRFWLTRGYSHVAGEHLAWFLPRLQNALSSAASNSPLSDNPSNDPFTDALNALPNDLSGAGARRLMAQGYTALGRALAAQGDLPAALTPLETALAAWNGVGDAAGMAGAQMDLGEVCYWTGRKAEALSLLLESERRARQAGDALLCAAVLLTLGSIALDEQDIPRAERLHEEALAFARQKDNRRLIARILCNLGEIAREQNRLDAARERGEEALAAAEVGDQAAGCYIRLSLGRTACDAGDPKRAFGYVQDCLRYVSKAGTRRLLMLALLLAAQVASLQGQQERCAVLLGAGSAVRDEVSVRLIQGEAEQEAALAAAARQALGEAGYEAACRRGMALGQEAAIAYALTEESVLFA